MAHQIGAAAWPAALVLMAPIEVGARIVLVQVRGRRMLAARRRAEPAQRPPPGPVRSGWNATMRRRRAVRGASSGKRTAMLQTDAAPGIHRVEDDSTNWYLVEADDGLTIVDAGVPRSWESLQHALDVIGRPARDIRALVLTHAHFDHVGFAERARETLGIDVLVHENDVPLTRHPWRYDHEQPRSRYLLTQPQALPIIAGFLRDRAFWPTPLRAVVPFVDGNGAPLPVPGGPRVLATPGHTYGHCSLHFPERDAVIAGDAVVMLDPYTARRGPRLVARAATADSERNLRSLDRLAETGARYVLTGHGPVWDKGAPAAVDSARAAPIA
jgi:glyoxylase-like metal-dependent hydrolase (beta-lactamase superfamily II)